MSKVAFLLADQFEDSEMKTPYDAVKEAGHQADIIGLKQGQEVMGKQGKASYTTDKAIADVNINDYDAVVIPGGSSPENLRLDSHIAVCCAGGQGRQTDCLDMPRAANSGKCRPAEGTHDHFLSSASG